MTIHPNLLNQTEFASFQLNCIYFGPKFDNVKLVWLKNEKILQLEDGVNQSQTRLGNSHPRRLLVLNYKQNYTNIGVLKFSYGIIQDSGVYKCVALHDSDAVRISLNDSAYLIVHKSQY